MLPVAALLVAALLVAAFLVAGPPAVVRRAVVHPGADILERLGVRLALTSLLCAASAKRSILPLTPSTNSSRGLASKIARTSRS